MPGEKGVQFLERTRQLHPRAIRILTTAYSDLNVAIEAVNSGAIYKYVTKSWDIPQLEVTLQRAVEFFFVQRERDLLLQEKLSMLQRMMIADRLLSLGNLSRTLGPLHAQFSGSDPSVYGSRARDTHRGNRQRGADSLQVSGKTSTSKLRSRCGDLQIY
jgi:response regulator RpfG family c-di-GMP phosphodiesterase